MPVAPNMAQQLSSGIAHTTYFKDTLARSIDIDTELDVDADSDLDIDLDVEVDIDG